MNLRNSCLKTPSARTLLESDTARLAEALRLSWAEARLEVRILLEHVLKVERAWLIAHEDLELQVEIVGDYEKLLDRRLAGEPIAYLLGQREFYGRSFKVGPEVLIPRPETELLIDLALARLPDDAPYDVLDLGTGSGCIATTLALERPACKVVGVDASQSALTLARGNALSFGAEVEWQLGSWYEGLAGRQFDLIVSNPPYIAQGDSHLVSGDVRFEPQDALTSGLLGLDDLTVIIEKSRQHLKSRAWLLLEHGWDQGVAVKELMRRQGFQQLGTCKDFAGHDRITAGKCR